MKSVLSSYTLSLAVFIPISGWMADRFGTRRVFASAIGLFTLGSLLCGISSNIHVLVACRILQGCGGAMMVPVGRLTHGAHLRQIRTGPRHELRCHPRPDRPDAGARRGRPDRRLFSLARHLLRQPSHRAGRPVHGLSASAGLPRGAHASARFVGLILFGSGIALLSYVLEVFGEHTLSTREILGLLASFARAAGRLRIPRHAHAVFPLLRLDSVPHPHVPRGGERQLLHAARASAAFPFLFPLLYQVGLGFTPMQSGLLMMPQAIAAMSLKMTMPKILARFGYRGVLISNTVILGRAHHAVRHHRRGHAGLADRAAGLLLRVLHLAAVHQHEHAGLRRCRTEQTSSASTIASTMQQMSISFGVASASLATAFFIPDRFHSDARK